MVGLYYAILGLFIILYTVFSYYVAIMYILLACRIHGYIETHRFVFSRHFLTLLRHPSLVFTDFVYVLRGNFIAQSDDLPFETVETPLPVLTFWEVLIIARCFIKIALKLVFLCIGYALSLLVNF
jgi:hypothetical protein